MTTFDFSMSLLKNLPDRVIFNIVMIAFAFIVSMIIGGRVTKF